MKNKILKIFVIMTLAANVSYAKSNTKIDKATFQEIDASYSKDKNGVYVWENRGWKKLEGLDPVTFEIINISGSARRYLKDKNGIYILTKESSIKTIKIDKNIKNIDFNSFEKITNYPYVFKDKNAVYTLNTDDDKIATVFNFRGIDYKINELSDANPKKFDMMELNYFKDDKNIFYFSDKEKMIKKIKNADIKSFEIMNDDYAKDKNGEYYRGEKIRENRGIK